MSQIVIEGAVEGEDKAGPTSPKPAPAAPRRKRRRNILPYGLVAPAAFLEMLIHILPMILGVWIAFISLNQLNLTNWTGAPFVGLQNFINGLNPNSSIGQAFFATVGRTAVYTILVVGFSWVLGMTAAVFLNSKFRGRALLRTFFLVPYALPAYVGTIAWAFMFNQRDGAVNQILVDTLHLFGDDRPFWLLGENSFGAMVIVNIWQMWPFAFLMLMAALQNIPNDVYEAASIDGASLWKQFLNITLPMVRPANAVLILVMCLWTFNQFNIPFVLFGAASPPEATLVSPLIYQNSFGSWNFGLGGAMSVLLLLTLFVVSFFYIRLVLPKGKDND